MKEASQPGQISSKERWNWITKIADFRMLVSLYSVVERTLLTWDNKQLPNQIWDSEWEVFVLSDECVCIFVCFSFHLYYRKNTNIAYTEIMDSTIPKMSSG